LEVQLQVLHLSVRDALTTYYKVLFAIIYVSDYLFIQSFQFTMLQVLVEEAGQDYFGAGMNVALSFASHKVPQQLSCFLLVVDFL
jgi:hypothetical protein